MKTEIRYIKEFDEKFGDYIQMKPNRDIPKEVRDLRASLMTEELKEVIEAMASEPIENIAKEFADLFLVLMGTVGAYGLLDSIESVIEEVHLSNMSKTPIPGIGKPQKLEGYHIADIRKVLGL